MVGQAPARVAKTAESEALIESSFRRLIASVEAERERIRSTWQQIESESTATGVELERLRQDTEEWCQNERQKVGLEWQRLDTLREKMVVRKSAGRSEVLNINCSGHLVVLDKDALSHVEGSYLNHMFSEAFVGNIPLDPDGRFFLDFNPGCFIAIVDYLHMLEDQGTALPPVVPAEQQQNFDLLVEALQLRLLQKGNALASVYGSSLRVKGNVVEATHMGWQVISAKHPLPMSGQAYFEVEILENPDASRGGLAVGVCGHVPRGAEVHAVFTITDAVLYNSGNGIAGSVVAVEDVQKGIQLRSGSVLGVKHDIRTRTLHWYHNRLPIGTCTLKPTCLEQLQVLYPVFALYCAGQKLKVDFETQSPSAARRKAQKAETAAR